MIPTIFVAVFAANQSGHSHAAKVPVPVPVTAPVMMSTTASRATQQQLEKLAAAQLDIHNQARHFIMLDDPTWLHQKNRSFLQEAK